MLALRPYRSLKRQEGCESGGPGRSQKGSRAVAAAGCIGLWCFRIRRRAGMGRLGNFWCQLLLKKSPKTLCVRIPAALPADPLCCARARRWATPAGWRSLGATLSHMEIGVRGLRNRTGQVIDAVRAGERVVLTVHGEAVADIVPHARRSRWVPGDLLRRGLVEQAADPALRDDPDLLAGQTLDEL